MIDKDYFGMIVFRREQAQDCFVEAVPMLFEHGRELNYMNGLKIEPEFSKYEILENAGLLRTYTARREKELVGYAVFFLQPHLHFRKTLFALCDILYITPNHRGFGLRFIRWCNHQLRLDGARVIYYYVNKQFDYGPILRRLGLRHTDELYTLRVF